MGLRRSPAQTSGRYFIPTHSLQCRHGGFRRTCPSGVTIKARRQADGSIVEQTQTINQPDLHASHAAPELGRLAKMWLLLKLRRHVLARLFLKRYFREIHDVVTLIRSRQVHRIRDGIVAPQ
jgi:hypothetical protein